MPPKDKPDKKAAETADRLAAATQAKPPQKVKVPTMKRIKAILVK